MVEANLAAERALEWAERHDASIRMGAP